MTAAKHPQPSRKQLVPKLHKVLKGHYKPVVANTGRSMLEQVLFACCLENAQHDAAEKAFSRLLEGYFDLNEIRVTTVAELAETLHGTTIKKILQAVNPEAIKERFPKRGEPLSAPNPPPPTAGKEGRRAAEAAQSAADEHRPAGPQAAARPAGKTPLPPPGAGPKRAADGTTKPGGKTGPKPFVVKPNVGKPITITPQLAAPAPEVKPAPTKQVKKPEAGGKPVAGKKSPPAAGKSAGDAKQKGKPPAAAGKSHSADLAKRKPR